MIEGISEQEYIFNFNTKMDLLFTELYKIKEGKQNLSEIEIIESEFINNCQKLSLLDSKYITLENIAKIRNVQSLLFQIKPIYTAED